MNGNRRVVVTGMGMLSPLGLSVAETWSNMCQGKSGVDYISLFDTADVGIKVAGEVKGFDPQNYMDKRTARRMSRTSQLALAAAKAAMEDSRLATSGGNSEVVGICVGTGVGCLDRIEAGVASVADSHSRVDPFGVISSLSNIPAALIASTYKLNGPSLTITTACASGVQALGEAAEQIRRGWAECMVCGGVDALVLRVSFLGFGAMGVMSRRTDHPAVISKPFDLERDGVVLGEGSAFFVLEERQHAVKRGANIYAELLGYSAVVDSSSLFLPDTNGDTAAETMRLAVMRSGLKPEAIDYIHAHGTATKANDSTETRAIKSVFGPYAHQVPISSSKSMIGHTMGASGAIGAALAIQAIQGGIVPPTINLNTPDPDCDLDYVPNKARRLPVRNVLVNAFGMGGQNACLVVGKYS